MHATQVRLNHTHDITPYLERNKSFKSIYINLTLNVTNKTFLPQHMWGNENLIFTKTFEYGCSLI